MNFPKIFAATFVPFFLFTACSEDDPAGWSSEPSYRSAQHITVDEKKGAIILQGINTDSFCVAQDDSTLSWKPLQLSGTMEFPYRLDGDHLELTISESTTLDLICKDHQSVYGTWYLNSSPIDSSMYMEITADSLISIEMNINSADSIEPVETGVPLGQSYFLYDFLRCLDYSDVCTFGHWHFEKYARSEIKEQEKKVNVTYTEKKDRYIKLTANNKEYTIEVQHAQVDSLNNGHARYEATILSQSDTCSFIHVKGKMKEEFCDVNYINEMSIFPLTADGITSYNVALNYVRDNDDEFARCVNKLIWNSK